MLRAQFALAEALGKPLVLHCRDAFAALYDELERPPGWDGAACSTAGPEGRGWTKCFASLGVVFSFAGPLTYPGGEDVRRAAALVSPERAMVDTDTPYLTPPPHREQPNEPAERGGGRRHPGPGVGVTPAVAGGADLGHGTAGVP